MNLLHAFLAALLAAFPVMPSNAATHEIDVPFRLLHNQITLPVRIGAREANMFLDTDTSPSAIDALVAKQLHLRITGKSEAATGEGTARQTTIPVVIPALSVGGVRAKNVAALTADFRGISRLVHTPIVGVLGTSFLRGRIFQIDYPRHIVRFFDAAAHLENGSSIPFQVKSDLIVVGLSVNGRHGVATIDTGSSSGLTITPHGVKQLSLAAARRASQPSKSAGYNGTAKTRKGSITGAVFDGIALGREPAEFWLEPGPVPWMDCDIGNAVLKKYVLTIDYVHHRLDIALPQH